MMANINRTAALNLVLAVVVGVSMPLRAAEASGMNNIVKLHNGWTIQSSCKVTDGGEVISSKAFRPQGWLAASVPTTVLAAQVAAGVYPDPYFGMNMRQLPGMSYRLGGLFSRFAMEPDSPYACSWWYRTTFSLPHDFARRITWLHFKGINYRANVWLNGRKLADANDVAGAYRLYEFDTSSFLAPGVNVLAVEVSAPTPADLAINWVDWNPAPPDKNMGLWGEVYLSASGPVSVRYPQVVTHFPDASLAKAELTVMADLHNASEKALDGVVEAVVDQTRLRQPVTLQPGEHRSVTFLPGQFSQLRIDQPKLWWPVGMGPQTLHDAEVRFLIGNAVSDEQRVRFGIREITSELTDKGHRLFRVNGKKVLIRGGGWAPDLMLRENSARLQDEFRYVLGMNLNTIRLEGKLETDKFFDLADRYGVLVMAGWCCCDIWEQWKKWDERTLPIATESLRTQILRLRSHPSLLVWLNGSDGPPPPDVEQAYIDVLKQTSWPNPYLSSATARATTVTGPSGVKMTGPYDYEPPFYWLVDQKYGGAYGFNTETSPGPAIPVAESIRKFIAADQLWPMNEVWNYHAGGERFQNVNLFNEAMNATYGVPANLEEYTTKSQVMTYDGQRAMFEAYARNKYTSTGVIQWMLNNAWPSTIWHLYDYYLQPAGGYFGTRKANEPVHIQYSYDDRSVVVVNSTYEPVRQLTVTAQVYDFDLKPLFSQKAMIDVEEDGIQSVFTLPPFPSEDPAVYFLRLSLQDNRGATVSSNFYWLPAKHATMAWDRTPNTAYTPIAVHEDMTMLNRLPRVRLELKGSVQHAAEGDLVRVTVRNADKHLAFHARLSVCEHGQEILPALWDDNYVSLMPGETRVLLAHYPGRKLPARTNLKVGGWNVEPHVAELPPDTRVAQPTSASR
jgi:exo-1,4-beta-D-glucosaminidase